MLISRNTINKSTIPAIIPHQKSQLQSYQTNQQLALNHEKSILHSGLPLIGQTVRSYQKAPDGNWYVSHSDAKIDVRLDSNPIQTLRTMERIQLTISSIPSVTLSELNAAREAAMIAKEMRTQLQKEAMQRINPYRSYLQLFSIA